MKNIKRNYKLVGAFLNPEWCLQVFPSGIIWPQQPSAIRQGTLIQLVRLCVEEQVTELDSNLSWRLKLYLHIVHEDVRCICKLKKKKKKCTRADFASKTSVIN